MMKVLIGVIALLVVVIALGGWQIDRLEGKITTKDTEIGSKNIVIQEQTASLIEYEIQVGDLEQDITDQDELLGKNKETSIRILSANTELKLKLEGLANENKEIKNILGIVVHSDIVQLLWQGESGVPAKGDLQETTGIPDKTDTGTINFDRIRKTLKQVINYCQDFQAALHSCNADKFSLEIWDKNLPQI